MAAIRWAEQTWETLRDIRQSGMDMVLLPVGSTEQHGPHLPLHVDTVLADQVANAVSANTGVPVLPALPYGCALGHTRHWPGTISLKPSTLAAVIEEIIGDVIAYGFQRILVLSGHVTNAAPLRTALETIRVQYPHVQIAQMHLMNGSPRIFAAYTADAADFHANAAETALMMHLTPNLVRTERIFDDPDRTQDLVFSYSVPQTSVAGHTGRPTEATLEMGQILFDMLVDDWTDLVGRALTERAPLDMS